VTGERPSVDTRQPDVRVHGFISKDECTLYLDTSGAPLYQRGLRQKTVDAPLKENLAAGILRLSGWQPGVALLDPMCGSGTFLLEAAQIGARHGARGRAISLSAAASVPFGDLEESARRRACRGNAGCRGGIFGSDLSPVAVRATLANLDRAGLLPAVSLSPAIC
jgi:putative N6-adenine-specific DNA methylase